MCDPVSAIGLASIAVSGALSAKNSHDQRKAQRKQEEIAEATERKQNALVEAKGAAQTSRSATAAYDEERKRRLSAKNNTVLTSRTGALGTPNTAAASLGAPSTTRTTLG